MVMVIGCGVQGLGVWGWVPTLKNLGTGEILNPSLSPEHLA